MITWQQQLFPTQPNKDIQILKRPFSGPHEIRKNGWKMKKS
jgi:hypothetical protein